MSFGGTIGQGGRPPSSVLRPGSQMMRTGYGGNQQPAMGMGMSLESNVEVAARPAVMREGMKGAMPSRAGAPPGTSAGLGPGRQVVDRTYYLGVLRPKIADLTAEIERLKGDEEKINKNSATLIQLQQKQKSLSDDITRLKSNMADVNFAVEKMATDDADSINQQALSLKQQNAEKRRAVDKTFLSVKEVDTQTRGLMVQLDTELQTLDAQLSSDPEFSIYKRTRDECYTTNDAVLKAQHEIRQNIARQDFLMSNLSRDADKKRAATVLLEIIKMRQFRDELKKECSVSIEEEKKNLMVQAKTITNDNDILSRQLVEAKESIQETKNRIASAEEDVNEYSGDHAQKFQELQEKDREMQEFMETYPQKEKEEVAKIEAVEKQITEILERISRAHTIKQQMPQENTPTMLSQMANELGEKENQFQNAKLTAQRLEKELEERKEELKKVSSLDERITSELQAVDQKMEEQRQDIARFRDIDGLRQNIDQRKKQLLGQKGSLTNKCSYSKQQIHHLTTEVDARKAKVNDNEIHGSLVAEEQKLRLLWQSAFSLRDFVRMKEKETQYNTIKAECMRVTDECNGILKDPRRFDSTAQQQGNVMILGA